jgi:predicted SprT family Zn-dependent metalloprotease
MLYFWDIEQTIKNTLNELNLDINVEISNKLNVPMSYNVSTNTIKFNYLKVNGYNAQINFKIKETNESFVKIILYHELGYYLDFKKNKRDLRILLYGDEKEKEQLLAEIEKNAWDYGRTLVPDYLLKSYDLVRELDKMLIKT